MLCRPSVSIGLPVYNGERYLAEAVDSILGQTFRDLELVICDNGSSDGTQDICLKYLWRDRRVKYYRSQENIGAARNFNRALGLAMGRYFRWAAHDDVLAPEYLARCVERLGGTPEAVVCQSLAGLIDEEGRCVGEETSGQAFGGGDVVGRFCNVLRVESFPEIWGLMRLEALRRTAGIGSYVGSDRNLMGELMLMGRAVYVPEQLFFRRDHPANYTRTRQSHRARLQWFDPERKTPAWLAGPIKCANYTSAILRSPMRWSERAACLGTLGTWAAGRAVAVAGRIPRRLVQQVAAPAREPRRPASAEPAKQAV